MYRSGQHVLFFRLPAGALTWLCILFVLIPVAAAEQEDTSPHSDRIDINAADALTLQQLPMIGPVLSEAIVRDRESYGPFPHPAALERVPRIGPATMQRLCPLIRAGDVVGCDGGFESMSAQGSADSCVNLNTATSQELESLRGIGPSRAQAIVRERESGGEFASVEDLVRVPGIAEGIVSGLRSGACVTHDLNRIDRATLRHLQVLSPEVADRIIDNREEHGPYMTLQSMLRVSGVRVEDIRELARFLHVRD